MPGAICRIPNVFTCMVIGAPRSAYSTENLRRTSQWDGHLPDESGSSFKGNGSLYRMTSTVEVRPSKAILLVDDDHLVRASVGQMLMADDYRVIEARDAHEALELWERHAA